MDNDNNISLLYQLVSIKNKNNIMKMDSVNSNKRKNLVYTLNFFKDRELNDFPAFMAKIPSINPM